MVKTVNVEEMKEETSKVFRSGFMCSETAIFILNKYFELGMPEDALKMSTGFPYGFGDGGNVCGGVAGATMCIGYLFGRTTPGDPSFKKCLDLVRELNDAVIAKFGTTICPVLIKDYEFKQPERKDHCTDIMMTVVEAFANIMAREFGVKLV